jgi:hypothetical protein
MPIRHRHRVGRHLVECEESGLVAYDDKIVKRWDGALVRRKAFETRQPQEFVRAKSDPKALKDIRPAQEAPQVSLGPALRVGTTNVPAPKGIGYRLTRTGVGTMRIGGSFVVDGEIDDVTEPAVSAAPLYYNPNMVCPLTSATTRHVTTGNVEITLNNNEHTIIVLGSGNRTIDGYVDIFGASAGSDNRVWIIGGHIANPTEIDTSASDGHHSHCLRFQRVKYAYVEGVRFDKMNTAGDCIHYTYTSAAGGKIWVQNCLGIRINYQDPAQFPGHAIEQHGDFAQISAQVSGAYFDKNTFYSWRQGIILNATLNENQFQAGPAVLEGVEMRRVNGHIYDTSTSTLSPQPTGAIAYRLIDSNTATFPITLDRVWIHDFQSPRETLNRLVLPSELHGQTTIAGINIWNDEMQFPAASQITGIIRYGTPPEGDYVPLTFTGLGYTSPGYRT